MRRVPAGRRLRRLVNPSTASFCDSSIRGRRLRGGAFEDEKIGRDRWSKTEYFALLCRKESFIHGGIYRFIYF